MRSCIKYAVDTYNVDVAILAHLDNMKEYTWRNLLQASPGAPPQRQAAALPAPLLHVAGRAVLF